MSGSSGNWLRKLFKKASHPEPEYVPGNDACAWNNHGASLHLGGREKEAIRCYDKALELDPRHPLAWHNKGISLNSLGRYEEAIHCFDKALELDPTLYAAWGEKGDILERLGRHEEAAQCHKKALVMEVQSHQND